jgi:hypothetical protein
MGSLAQSDKDRTWLHRNINDCNLIEHDIIQGLLQQRGVKDQYKRFQR